MKKIEGTKVGSWLIYKEVPKPVHLKTEGYYYCCICKCGVEKIIIRSSLLSSHTTQCRVCGSTSHGMTKSRLYSIWKGMVKRTACEEKHRDYGSYKHVTLCNKWKKFIPFKDWALKNGYTNNLEIDRIDNSKGYNPNNCRWVTGFVQAANKAFKKTFKVGRFVGVFKRLDRKSSWNAAIMFKGTYIFKKSFKCFELAALKRDEFILENNLPHCLNFYYTKPNLKNKRGWIFS